MCIRDRVNEEFMETSRNTFRYAMLNMPVFQLILYSAIIFIMWFGGNMILSDTLSVGDLTGFLTYVFQILNAMMMISNVFLLLTRSLASAHPVSYTHLDVYKRQGLRGDTFFFRTFLNFLTVLISTRHKPYIISAHPFVTRNGIGRDGFIGVADVRFARCVGDGSGDVKRCFFVLTHG